MRRMWALLLVCLVSLPVSASQGGENESISLDGTGIETLYYDEVMGTSIEISDSEFSIILKMEDDSNVSNIKWITQVCINSGICHPPQENQMDRGDDGSFGSHLDTEPGYSYINWKFVIEWRMVQSRIYQMLASVGESGQTAGSTMGRGEDPRHTARRRIAHSRGSRFQWSWHPWPWQP